MKKNLTFGQKLNYWFFKGVFNAMEYIYIKNLKNKITKEAKYENLSCLAWENLDDM